MRPDLTLMDKAVFAPMHEFDGILDGDDVMVFGLVDEIDHRREGGRFSGTGGAGHQHQTAAHRTEPANLRRQTELFDCHDF